MKGAMLIKMVAIGQGTWAPFQYKDYCKDKTVVKQSYLYDDNLYTGKTALLYWDESLEFDLFVNTQQYAELN